jgi:sugar phosphate isomerase/epimerase
MARPAILCTQPWADLPVLDLAPQIAEWGYQGLELWCGGDHLEVQLALSDEDYVNTLIETLNQLELRVLAVSSPTVSLLPLNGARPWYREQVPDYVWGNGDCEGVQERSVEELASTVRVAQKLGAGVLVGRTGSPLWSALTGPVPLHPRLLERALEQLAQRWQPILDVCQECGVRFACQVGPGEMAFDLDSAARVVEAVTREEFGFALDPVGLHVQGVNPAEFVRAFPDRIYHVHVKDAVVALNGRSSLFGSYLPPGDPRRCVQPRSPGRGGIDWEGVIRALNGAGYAGPLAIAWEDPGMDRAAGAAEALTFLRRVDFEPPSGGPLQAFH